MADRRRLALLVLLLIGFAAAVQLALVQLSVLGAWDPLFGDGTTRVLTSAPARALPFPDAALGALAYALEIALVLAGATERDLYHRTRSLALAVLAVAMGLGGVVLIGLQALVVGAFCTLCLASAFVSIVVALTEIPVLAALRRERRATPNPRSQAHRIYPASRR